MRVAGTTSQHHLAGSVGAERSAGHARRRLGDDVTLICLHLESTLKWQLGAHVSNYASPPQHLAQGATGLIPCEAGWSTSQCGDPWLEPTPFRRANVTAEFPGLSAKC